MVISRIKNFEQYCLEMEKLQPTFDKIWLHEKDLTPKVPKAFSLEGISYPGKSVVNFHVDFEYANGMEINWRERLICPKTGLNNRLRACVHFAEFELGLKDYHKIYINEQVTPFYNYLKKQIPDIIGSEYLGDNYTSGTINENGIRHEDMTQLSFNDETFDFYFSFECFEHIPNYHKSFEEAFRVLKKDGTLFFSVPFIPQNAKNITRATINDQGEIVHILPPEYHGNPMSDGGSLCFTHFGWEMLDELREIGFKNVYALQYWSEAFGYLGGQQLLFFAVK